MAGQVTFWKAVLLLACNKQLVVAVYGRLFSLEWKETNCLALQKQLFIYQNMLNIDKIYHENIQC